MQQSSERCSRDLTDYTRESPRRVGNVEDTSRSLKFSREPFDEGAM